MKQLITIVFLLFSLGIVKAQYYESGVEPFSTKWRQMSNGKIRLIYPSDAEIMANKYLQLLSITDTIIGKDFNIKASKVDVILHNHSALSNGMVAWAPRRMELITFPSFDGYPLTWSYQLALHEMRHVKQMYALNRNAIKFTSIFFGQQATGLAAGMVPLWFLEGDAVAAESAFSSSGRGRSASFYQGYRAHYLNYSKTFSYDKWLLGSYKDNIPNHYSLGYQIVAYGNLKYGDNIWASTIDYVTRKPFTIFPFYFGLKKQIGLSRKQLANEAFAYQDSFWTAELNNEKYTEAQSLTNPTNDYINYQYPYKTSNSDIIAYKSSLHNIPAFVQLTPNSKSEKVITYPGYLMGKPFINDSLIIWSEYKPHARWEYKSYGKIVKYNYIKKTKHTFQYSGMLAAPVYDPLKNKIYCIEYIPSGSFNLVALDQLGGKSEILSFPANMEPFEISINRKTSQIYVAVTTKNGKEVLAINPSNSLDLIFGPTYLDLNSIVVNGDSIYFSATSNFAENIFLHNILTNKTYQIVNSIYGSNYPSFSNNNSLVFSNYTPNGFRISELDSVSFVSSIDTDVTINDSLTSNLAKRASIKIDTIKITNIEYKSKPYKGFGTLINFHSWAPFYFNPYNSSPDESSIKLGATVMSQNLTGSTVLVLGYGYGNSHLFRANLSYRGFWPIFSLSFELLDYNAWLYPVRNAIYNPSVNRNTIKFYSYLPFTLKNNSYSTYLQLFSNTERTNDFLYEESIAKYRSGLLTTNYGIYFFALRKQSHRDILPRLGIVITSINALCPFNKNNIGSLNLINTVIYLPGIFSNHHLRLSASLQKQHLKHYYLTNKVDPPRGYTLYQSEKYKGFTADYIFPLAYPDFSIGSLAYIKRLSLDLFIDYAKNSYPTVRNNVLTNYTQYLQSLGFEVNIDFHVFRTRYPFRLKYQQAFTGNNFLPYSNFSLTYNIYGDLGREKHIEH